jgi:hypothetical protein
MWPRQGRSGLIREEDPLQDAARTGVSVVKVKHLCRTGAQLKETRGILVFLDEGNVHLSFGKQLATISVTKLWMAEVSHF